MVALGHIIPRGLCVSGHVVRPFVSDYHRNTLTEKAPYRDLGNRFGMFYNDIGNYKKRL